MVFPHLEAKWTPTLMGSTLNVVTEDPAAVASFGTSLGAALDSLFEGAPAISTSILGVLQDAVASAKAAFPVTARACFSNVRAAKAAGNEAAPSSSSSSTSTSSSSSDSDSSAILSCSSSSSSSSSCSSARDEAWDLHAYVAATSVSEATASIVAVPAVAVPAAVSAASGEQSADGGGGGVGPGDPLMARLLGYAFDHLHDIFTVSNFEGTLERVNPVTERILGWTAEELTSRPYQYFLHPDDVEPTKVLVTSDMAKGLPASRFTNRWRKKNGTWATISWHGVPVLDEGKIIGIGRDVTAEIEARAVAMRAVERLRVIVDSVNDGIIECDMHGSIISVDRGLRQLLACPADPSPIPFLSITDFVVPGQDALVDSTASDDIGNSSDGSESASGVVGGLAEPVDGKKLVSMILARRVTQNVRLWRTDRSEVLVDMTAAVFAPGGETGPQAVIITIRDVADRVHAEHEARAHSDALRRLEVKNEFVASMSHEIRTPLNGILGAVEALMDEEMPERHLELIATAYDCGSTLLSTINAILEDSKEASTLGESISMDWFILRAVVDDALVAVRSRAEIGKVALSCEIDDTLPAMLKGDAGRFRQVLLNLLSNAVKFSGDGGTVSVHAWAIDAPKSAATTAEAVNVSPALARATTMSTGGCSTGNDRERERERSAAANNNNAAGAQSTSGRSSRSGKSGSSSGQMWMRLEVRDTGVGIDKDKLETIFEAFAQADASIAKVYGGTGLGLNICRRIIEAMDGKIWAESEPGVGSTFIVECPFGKSRSNASQSSGRDTFDEGHVPEEAQRHETMMMTLAEHVPRGLGSAAMRGTPGAVTVLVIDDFPPNLLVIKSILSHLGCMVDTSRSAEEALSLISSEDSPVYSLILTDVNMPRMNGIDFTQHVVKKMGYPAPVVVVTAGGETHRENAIKAGASGYLAKPVSKSSLHNVVVKHTHLIASSEDNEAPCLRVLYADDAEINGEVAKLILDSLGSSLTFVDNAAKALRALVAVWSRDAPGSGSTGIHPSEVNSAIAAVGVDPFHPDLAGEVTTPVPKGGYDIVFFDEHMPGMDGTAAVRALRSIEGAHGLPRTFVALLSGETGVAFEREAINAGADMVLAKPFSKRSFRAAISTALKRRRRLALSAEVVERHVTRAKKLSPVSKRHATVPPNPPVIDAEAVVDLGTLPIIPRVIDLTTEEIDSWLEAVREGVKGTMDSNSDANENANCNGDDNDNDNDNDTAGTNGSNDSNDGGGASASGGGLDMRQLALTKLHKIKGAAGNVGLASLAAAAEEMETRVKREEKGHGNDAESMVARLRRELDRARVAIEKWEGERM